MTVQKSTSLLFEIGVEEIPAGYLAGAETSVYSKAPGFLSECGFQWDEFHVYTTPRRIVIHAEGFRSLPVQEEEKLGPLKDQAYQNGGPAPALLGFLKSTNRTVSDVFLKETPRGVRACVKVKRERKPLRYFFETLPRQIEFPKLMRWEATRCSFTRPIRWTFAFMGKQLQHYQIGDVKSSSFSYGRRFFTPSKFRVVSADFNMFEKLLLKHHVILKTEERVKKIRSVLKNAHAQNEELIQTVANLVEEPFVLRGEFDKIYLKLPTAVLTTCMSKHQKIFACYDSQGQLLNQFIAIINGPRKNLKLIAKNYESVLTSRLEDAQFFFQEDRKTKLEVKTKKLKDMIFLGSLGSYQDKTKRLVTLVEFLSQEGNLSKETIQNAKRAAQLAKADLTTHLVYEFPELQGKAGCEYARLDGEGDVVAKAIWGHYLPVNLTQSFQDLKKELNFEGALVGLSDRIDLLVGALGLGVVVTGSEDPYALRRASGGIVKIMRAYPFKCSLSQWIRTACDQYGKLISKSWNEIAQQLVPFFKERLVFELQAKAGTKESEILHGIFASSFDDIAEVYDKFNHLIRELNNHSFLHACKVMERTGNILKGVKGKVEAQIEPSLFQESLERALFDLLIKEESHIKELIRDKQYGAAIKRYGEVFYEPVHDFFDRVLVNTEDPKTRTNRQALVKRINSLCADDVADLSYVTNV